MSRGTAAANPTATGGGTGAAAPGGGPAGRGTGGGVAGGAAPGRSLNGAGPTRDESFHLRQIVTACARMSTLAAQTTDVAAITRLLFDDIAAAVVMLDPGLEVMTSAGLDEPQREVARLRREAGPSGLNAVLAAAAHSRRALTVPIIGAAPSWVVVAPVSVGESVAAYLVTIGDRAHELGENLRLMVIEHAAMICGVVLSRDAVIASAASRAQRQLFEGLLLARDRDREELDRWARHLGLDPEREHQVIVGTVAEPQQAAATAVLVKLAPAALVVAWSGEVVAVVPTTATDAVSPVDMAALAGRWVEAAGRRGLGAVSVGVGTASPSASGISRSYAEAHHAVAAAARMRDAGPVTMFAELGIHRLLLRVPDVTDLRSFADEVMGRLLDGGTGAEYLATLAVYFEENRSLQRAAKRLHIHPNTVTYRIRRVEEITGLSLDLYRDRLMAEVAVEILGSLGGRA